VALHVAGERDARVIEAERIANALDKQLLVAFPGAVRERDAEQAEAQIAYS
jgi:hypothetical protein